MKTTPKKLQQARVDLAQLRTNSPTPPDPDGLNELRSDMAFEAVALFMAITGTDAEDAVADLLSDLRHLCDRHGRDFAVEDRRGYAHYVDETHGQGQWVPLIGDCTFSLTAEPDDVPPHAELDDDERRRIEKLLQAGNQWAWCAVTVTCMWTDPNTGQEWFGHDYLGGCSYENADDFKFNSGYWPQMQKSAYEDLCAVITDTIKI
jgi:hypothetical protein